MSDTSSVPATVPFKHLRAEPLILGPEVIQVKPEKAPFQIKPETASRTGTKAQWKRTKLVIPRLQASSSSNVNRNTNKKEMDSEYKWGILKKTVTYMILTVLIFNILLPFIKLTDVSMDDTVAVVWRMSCVICTQFFLLMLSTRVTGGTIDNFFRVFVVVFLAFVVASIVGQLPGMAVAHIGTAWASGLFGYSFAEYCQNIETEKAAHLAVALKAKQSKKKERLRMDTMIHCMFTVSLVILCLAARLLWVVLIPSYDDVLFMVFELSLLIWWILCCSFLIVSQLLLQGLIISSHCMCPIITCHLVSYPLSIIFFLLSEVVWVYYFALQMMVLAAVLGYVTSIYSRYMQLLAGGSKKPTRIAARSFGTIGAVEREEAIAEKTQITAHGTEGMSDALDNPGKTEITAYATDDKSDALDGPGKTEVTVYATEDGEAYALDGTGKTEIRACDIDDGASISDAVDGTGKTKITACDTEVGPAVSPAISQQCNATEEDVTLATQVKLIFISKRKEPPVVSNKFCRRKGLLALC